MTLIRDHLGKATAAALHVEMRDAYGVATESQVWAAWQAAGGGTRATDEERSRRAGWLNAVAEATERGVKVRRVRIVSVPVSLYSRFLYAGTGLNIEAGEEVRWLPRPLASDIALPGNDFWLFDDATAVFNLFDGDGGWCEPGFEQRTEPSVVELCSSAFAAAWTRATQHDQFVI
ncbi:DUF6879 family protein [Catenulispora rubra]|uniref:DUF6879 family protein n=1 Tax=Catenulispora rubra TaxID=280293 RepID=UPI0018921513|nr:DUF6879 family protein [Catenulispora rubra]